MKHISFVVVYIIIFGLSSSNFLDCHLQDTAYREIKRFFPLEWKRASNLGGKLMCQLDSRFFVGKKFVGHAMLDDNYSKIRKNSKMQQAIIKYETVPYGSNNYEKWNY
ncbi:uncharacterized protein LOC112693584 isoform X2 [Sipha flava]|uniref:Uncharacterized protein LOC112693584 isoform X2 n=1 Tax=Sipha flava TaxID=143950 RepID=A0A8B8GNC1_9HEMI|nr:uncharacterized protein LOC112693584 isoform X2 [Sipha flava]